MTSRLRNFVFTWNNYPDDHEAQLKAKDIEYIVYQEERGENGTPHLQGYIELKNQTAFRKVARWFAWHIEKRKGSQQEAIDYCSKQDSRDGDQFTWGVRKQMGSRTDIKAAYEAIKLGKRKRDVAEEMPMVDAKYHRALDRYRSLVESDEAEAFRRLDVTVLYGEPGTGKTRKVMEDYPKAYILNQPEGTLWWDGYEGEEVLLIDDFYGWIKWGMFLKVLDGYKLRLPIKGGHTYARWKKVFITSNQEPEKWYPSKGYPLELSRRINSRVKYGALRREHL